MNDNIDTKKLLDEYFKTRPQTTVAKIRGQIDRQELYVFENKINKKLIEMDAIDIAEMIRFFINKNEDISVFRVSNRSYETLLSIIRDFFNWYIDKYEVIKNPCNDKRIKGKNARNIIGDRRATFSREYMEAIISTIRNEEVEIRADYLEAIVRMFYEGFTEAIDIVNLKERDVDSDNGIVQVGERNIRISNRLNELLKTVHDMDEFPARRGSYIMSSYRGSYFKFPTREKFINELNDREPEYMAGYISRVLNRELKLKLKINVNGRMLYLLGLYDYIVKKKGKEYTDNLITSEKNPQKTRELKALAESYGVNEQNQTTIKKLLLPYVDV